MRTISRLLALSVVMLSPGCGPEDAPPPPAPAKTRPASGTVPPKPPTPVPPEVAKRPTPPPAPPSIDTSPALPTAAPSREPELGPVPGSANDPALTTASFTFRTMDHAKADLFVNGHKHAATACLWSVTLNTAFDPKVTVAAWPPPGAVHAGAAKIDDQDGKYLSTVELWIAGGKYERDSFRDYRRQYPHLADGEHLLFVKADLRGTKRTGAVRVRVVGASGGELYRWVAYLPGDINEESDAARLFKRAFWFESD